MNFQKKLIKGMTTFEILVVLIIISILVGLAAFGTSAVFRNSRNTRRTKIVDDLKFAYFDVFKEKGKFPTNIKKYGLASTTPGFQWLMTNNNATAAGPIVPVTFKQFDELDAVGDFSRCLNEETIPDHILICFNPNTKELATSLENSTGGYIIEIE